MADKPPMIPPPSEPFPGSRTPGWNDPPTLQYNPLAGSSTSNKTRLNLNKRVAFPLQGTVGALSNTPKPTAVVPPNQTSNLPPLPPPVATITPMPMHSNMAGATCYQPIAVVHPTTHTTASLAADIQQSTMNTLRQQVAFIQEDTPNKKEEIERRLGIVEQLWQSNVLNSEVQAKLHQLSKAIVENNFTAAMEIYTMLVTIHSNECASWAVALRHLVLTLQPTSSTAMNTTPVYFVPATTNAEPMDTCDTSNSAVQNI